MQADRKTPQKEEREPSLITKISSEKKTGCTNTNARFKPHATVAHISNNFNPFCCLKILFVLLSDYKDSIELIFTKFRIILDSLTKASAAANEKHVSVAKGDKRRSTRTRLPSLPHHEFTTQFLWLKYFAGSMLPNQSILALTLTQD